MKMNHKDAQTVANMDDHGGSFVRALARAMQLADPDNLPPPEVIAQEIVDDLEAALEQFRLIADDMAGRANKNGTAKT
jgi:hypothetical protein